MTPHYKHNEMVNNTIEKFRKENALWRKTAEGLKIELKTPEQFVTPKTHK